MPLPNTSMSSSEKDQVEVDISLAGPPTALANGKPASDATQAPKSSHKPSADASTPVVFRDLTYSVKNIKNKKEKLSILKNLNGCFEPGEMSALMGPSGSGKTTLLDVLAGRKTTGTINGEVLFAAQKPTLNFLRRFTGYVEQFDTLLDILTVREMLLYTAELKRPVKESLKAKEATVDYFIDKLNLESCKDTPIGNSMKRGISGGQSKRTNIALAMVVNPRVLFLDEPTSGLDSYTANEVMTVVKGLTAEGVTICATIHSPSPYTFDLFDRLMVLVRGETVYFGPNGQRMLDYFHGSDVKPPETTLDARSIANNADYLTDLVVGADREGRAGEYADAYARSDLKRGMDEVIRRHAKANTMNLTKEQQADLQVKRATATPLWKGFATLVKYRTTRNYCSGEFLGPRIGDKLIFSLLVGTLYLGVGDDFEPSNYLNMAAVLFMWFGAASYVPALTLEKPLFVRERADGLYKPITYLLSKFFDELFITIFSSLIFSIFVFFVVDLQGSFLLFWLVYLLTLSIGICCAYVIAILSPNMDIANAALPTYTVTLLFFAGFLFRFDDIPKWWQWYAYLDYLRYGFGAHLINQFGNEKGAGSEINGVPIIEYYGYDDYNKWELLGYESLFFVAFFFMAWAALQFKTLSKR